jgi:hypothetical protein
VRHTGQRLGKIRRPSGTEDLVMADQVRGERISSIEGRTRRHTAGRVCERDGCETKLSIYNDGSHCSLHAPMVVPRTRGRKLPAA